ncbi:right-handed parallel beta-helix repeat-containing protein [Tahibacter sp.]|uniref:right-handed parallel beta-helix repeat-containing protein n=1 Tax=Tahibacter sp. TaxID=2056211 RepID=UPI0028C477B3|nr:right-handed parallel beta-helix repeat-containing protein [Tahibacter sp.]
MRAVVVGTRSHPLVPLRALIACVAVALGTVIPVASAQAATFLVTSSLASGAGTLRDAMTQAQVTAGAPHTIIFSLPANSVIGLASALPTLTSTPLVIDGSATPGLVVDGLDTARPFEVGASSPLTLRDLTIRNGFINNDRGGCIRVTSDTSTLTLDRVTLQGCRALSLDTNGIALGGAVSTEGGAFVYRSVFADNLARASGSTAGGAMDVRRSLWIENSRFEGNEAISTGSTGAAGGAVITGTGTLTVLRSQFIDNRAVQTVTPNLSFGGAISARDRTSTTVRQSLFLRNESGQGAALYAALLTLPNTMNVTVSNTTFAGNLSGPSLSLRNARVDLRNNTFWRNSGRSGLGAHLNVSGANTTINAATHNLLAGSADGSILCSSSSLPSGLQGTGSNLIADTSCSYLDAFSYINSGDLRIRGLRATGSALHDIPVVDLFAGSPAIDSGNPDGPGAGTVFVCTAGDARDEARPADGDADGAAVCDIGAHELQREASLFADGMEPMLLR